MQRSLNLLLADDDTDDCMFFKDALEEIPVPSSLKTVKDGVELMQHLSSVPILPDAVFLDLNMPRKNGFDCLTEIKSSSNLNTVPIIIYSTSMDKEVVDMLYEKGAQHYIRKPGDFLKLKQVIYEALISITNRKMKVLKEEFIIEAK